MCYGPTKDENAVTVRSVEVTSPWLIADRSIFSHGPYLPKTLKSLGQFPLDV